MMTMNQTDRGAQVRAVRRDLIDKARPSAERYLSDSRYDWLRPLARRRLLVVASLMVIAAHSAALALGASPLLSLPLLAGGWGAYSLLKWAVRGMADLPEELIDERMREVRDRQYRVAYTGLSAVMVVALLILWISADATRIAWRPEAHHLEALFWGFTLTAISLPSMAVAWSEPEV